LVLEDDFDPLMIQAFQQQPADLSPIQALRKAMIAGFSLIPKDELAALKERMELAQSVPELRAASLNQFAVSMQMIAGLVADRIGRDHNDFHVLTFAGAVIGLMMGVQAHMINNPDSDFVTLVDQAMEHLETGLALPNYETTLVDACDANTLLNNRISN
jgi:hypothetical protein